jgi:predicted MFS family arabinose efflux permease
MNGSRLVGPAVAGLIIDRGNALESLSRFPHAGASACFLLNFVSYPAVIAALYMMRPAPRETRAGRRHVLHELREGLAYAWRTPAIRLVLVFLAGLSLLGIPYAVLMPVFAKEILKGDAQTLGNLMSSVGVGAVVGTALLAMRPNPRGLGELMAAAAVLFGAALVAFSFSETVWLSMLILTVAGFGLVSQVVSGNTLLQTLVDDDKRGRVMGLHAVAFLGMMPFGSLLAGWAAEHLGAPHTVLICGIATLAGAAVFSTRLGTLSRALARVHPTEPEVDPPEAR